MPDPRYGNLGKKATIFAVILIVSTGLCGLTALATRNQPYGGPVGAPLAILELCGMVIGALGLVAIGLIALVKVIAELVSPKDPQ